VANDKYDDRGRDDDRDDRDDRGRDRSDDRDDRRGGGDPVAMAKQKVSAPAVLLIIAGIIGLLFGAFAVFQAFTSPYAGYENSVKIVEMMVPAGQQRDEAVAKLAAQKEDSRLDKPLSLIQYAACIVLNLLTVVGGFSMKSLGNRGLAMTGAIAAIIPLSGCCFLTTPFGIWAVVVLANDVVKRGFALNGGKRPGPASDADDDRWGDSGR
jgi:uncharacterized membrane protein